MEMQTPEAPKQLPLDPAWVPPVDKQLIDGNALFVKTLASLDLVRATQVAGGAITGGAAAVSGCLKLMFAGGGLFGLALLFFFAATPQGGNGRMFISLLLVGVILGAGYMVLRTQGDSTFNSRLARHLPSQLTDQQIKEKGARPLTDRERSELIQVARQIQLAGQTLLQGPEKVMILTTPDKDHESLGDVVFLSRAVIRNPQHLAPVLAHELSYIQNGASRIRLGVNLLNRPVEDLPYTEEWRDYWRQQRFLADEMAVSVGFGHELLDYLKYREPLEVTKPYYEQQEPYIAERIDRLEAILDIPF